MGILFWKVASCDTISSDESSLGLNLNMGNNKNTHESNNSDTGSDISMASNNSDVNFDYDNLLIP